MSYILSTQRDADCSTAFQKYEDYLKVSKERLPNSVNDVVSQTWWFDFQDHRCPHDSWIEEIRIREGSEGKRREIRWLDIHIRLLGAYHDGYLEITYKNVKNYELGCDSESHGGWRYDQFLVADGGFMHEIEWRDGTIWKIEAECFEYKWMEETSSEQNAAHNSGGRAPSD